MPGQDRNEFAMDLVHALSQSDVVDTLHTALKPLFKTMDDALVSCNNTIVSLKNSLTEKDKVISHLQSEVTHLQIRCDDLEQYSRRGSVRFFGVSESGRGDTEAKVPKICNEIMKVEPPLCPDDIEVCHRVGTTVVERPSTTPPAADAAAEGEEASTGDANSTPATDDGSPPASDDGSSPENDEDAEEGGVEVNVDAPGRPILVKFLSRRIKMKVMALTARKNLRTYKKKSGAIYVSDDLTRRRARLAFEARNLKRQGLIKDTWIHDSNILIKDIYGRISAINSERDLSKFLQNNP